MGNHPSAVVDDGQSSVHRQSYTVRGDLYARSVTASTINARVVYARRITCQRAQISRQEPLLPQNYPNPPHRSITAHTLNVDAIYADEINCKTLRAYDVCVGDGNQFRAKRVEWQDRNQVGWDGKEDDESEASDNDSDEERTSDEDRARRKKMLKYGAAGAMGLALGGAALAYTHHRKHEKEEEEEKKKEEEERRRREEEERRRREDEERRRREQEQQQQHHQPPAYQQPIHNAPAPVPHHDSSHDGHHQKMHGGNYHLSSRNVRLWSDGNHCFLVAECNAGGDRWQESRIDLDNIITNADGEFRWVRPGQVGNFSGSAERWEIVDSGNVMVADLRKVDGSMHRRRFVLSEHITNDGGNLRYIE
ncbi:CVNH domain-containing protein [Macrophomina phaseolina]|uniref:CVNH domain-containing protein n=1 Tax=Macrophomina phaseolina TaxID=35725 RepID=A0ABQ8FRJ9_9PEZI|nr:CVNH domain-containing protein [Macrophomina phaseolina]